MKDVPYRFLSTKALFTESFLHLCFVALIVILNCKSITHHESSRSADEINALAKIVYKVICKASANADEATLPV